MDNAAEVAEGYLVLEPDVAKDSSAEATILLKAIDWAVEEFSRKGLPLPENLVIEVGGW